MKPGQFSTTVLVHERGLIYPILESVVMNELECGDKLIVHVTGKSPIADGLCLERRSVVITEGKKSLSVPIHIRGDVEKGKRYQVTITDIRASSIIAEVDHPIKQSASETEDTRTVWWVDTQRAECIHTSKSCKMLARREGKLLSTEIPTSGQRPEQVSNKKKCEYCH